MDTTNFRCCPVCGEPLEIPPEAGGSPACSSCGRIFYSAPHPTVSAIIVDDDNRKLLLTRRGVDPLAGWLDLPGGFLDMGETLEDGLRRELKEELGVDVRIEAYLGSFADVYGEDAIPTINAFFVARIAAGAPAPDSDVAAIEWFPYDALPSDVAFENGKQALKLWRKSLARVRGE